VWGGAHAQLPVGTAVVSTPEQFRAAVIPKSQSSADIAKIQQNLFLLIQDHLDLRDQGPFDGSLGPLQWLVRWRARGPVL
jgi:hypothetical protein